MYKSWMYLFFFFLSAAKSVHFNCNKIVNTMRNNIGKIMRLIITPHDPLHNESGLKAVRNLFPR